MRIVIYDRNPGTGPDQWFLMVCWAVACFFQKLFGPVDAYYGAESWGDALRWILSQPKPVTSIQYWGHGSAGRVWLAQQMVATLDWLKLKPALAPEAILWFRTCATFRGAEGHEFSRVLANGLNCTVAGHTSMIGPLQGGLHTRKPGTVASWPVEEACDDWMSQRQPNIVSCLATKIPPGW